MPAVRRGQIRIRRGINRVLVQKHPSPQGFCWDGRFCWGRELSPVATRIARKRLRHWTGKRRVPREVQGEAPLCFTEYRVFLCGLLIFQLHHAGAFVHLLHKLLLRHGAAQILHGDFVEFRLRVFIAAVRAWSKVIDGTSPIFFWRCRPYSSR